MSYIIESKKQNNVGSCILWGAFSSALFFFTDQNTVYFLKIRAWQVIYNPAGNEHE